MIGLHEFDNDIGIHVVQLDLEADPAKRSDEAQAAMFVGMSEPDIQREYKRNWRVATGQPVYAGQFVKSWHVAPEPLLAYPNLPLYGGWDAGPTHTAPARIVAQLDPMGRINVLAEFYTWDGWGDAVTMDFDLFTEDVLLKCNADFYGADWIDYADPAGWGKSTLHHMSEEKSCVDILRRRGVHPKPGPMTFTARKEAMNGRLRLAIGGRAAIWIDPSCHMLIEGFEGAYRYEQIGETGRFKPTVEKNAWSHPMNALEYIVGALFGKTQQRERDPEPAKQRRRDKVTGY